MWSGYRGGKPASEMGPPSRLPSEAIRLREHVLSEHCWCQPRVEGVDSLRGFKPEGFASEFGTFKFEE
jgi:hypothetical protein